MKKPDPFENSHYTTPVNLVDPFGLEVEWAVDEEHVTALAKDIKECGKVLVPVMVWGPERKIADGFHRVAAAQRVKYEHGYPKLIPTTDLDEPEWRFWEVRILSAHQHKGVEEDRLLSWVYHCWRTGPWQSKNLITVLDAIRLEVREAAGRAVFSNWNLENVRREDFDELCEWINDKAQKWGIGGLDLCDAVVFQHLLREWDLTPTQKRLISRSIEDCSLIGFNLVLAAWIRGKRTEGKGTYFEAARAVDALVEKPERAEQLDGSTLGQFLRPPETSAPARRVLSDEDEEGSHQRFTRDCAFVLHFLRTKGDTLSQVPKAKEGVQTFILEVLESAAQIWPDPFAVWHRRLALGELGVTDEHLAIPSSVIEARD